MSRFSRINTIWRKELIDTLRDRRTVAAMVLVPMVLYPAMILGLVQGTEIQRSSMAEDRYNIGVESREVDVWLRSLISADMDRRKREASPAPTATQPESAPTTHATQRPAARREGAVDVREKPPEYQSGVFENLRASVSDGVIHVGLRIDGPLPARGSNESAQIHLIYDETDPRSVTAAEGLRGILEREKAVQLSERLKRFSLRPDFIEPIEIVWNNIATPERMSGSALGQFIPLLLVIMTVIGAMYPAIDLTAGERERGTLETLMVAPVPTVDLIAGKFIVVTLVGIISAVLNLISMAGAFYLGGVGTVLMPGGGIQLPYHALPLVLLLLIPLAVMFSALLLAVCSFARSFKEAQNYIMPVMMAALIPSVVGILPGTRLEGPITIMPVANIVVLTREMFLGKYELFKIGLVLLTTCLYAGTAVAIAAKLFGQEAVLFADSGSVKALFQRRFFKPRLTPSTPAALLTLVIVFSLTFFLQQSFNQAGMEGFALQRAVTVLNLLLMVVGPFLVARHIRARIDTTFALGAPPLRAWIAAGCFGAATWLLAIWWQGVQNTLMPMDPITRELMQAAGAWINDANPVVLLFYMAIMPAICEEAMFRGFVLSGVRSSLGKIVSVAIVALAFGLFHFSSFRMVLTTSLGLLLGLLVVQYRSIWPAIVAHALHNGLLVLAASPRGLKPWLDQLQLNLEALPNAVVLGAAGIVAIGVAICLIPPRAVSRDSTAASAVAAR